MISTNSPFFIGAAAKSTSARRLMIYSVVARRAHTPSWSCGQKCYTFAFRPLCLLLQLCRERERERRASLSSIPSSRAADVRLLLIRKHSERHYKISFFPLFLSLALNGDCSYRFFFAVHCWYLSTRVIFSSNSRLERDSFHPEAHFLNLFIFFL